MKISVPRGACDTHMHFYNTKAPVAQGTIMPGHFPVEDYRAMQKRLGLERLTKGGICAVRNPASVLPVTTPCASAPRGRGSRWAAGSSA
jgi:hypothetical protein